MVLWFVCLWEPPLYSCASESTVTTTKDSFLLFITKWFIVHMYSPLQVTAECLIPYFSILSYLWSWPLSVKHFKCLSDNSIPWKKCSGADFQLVELPCYISCASGSRELPKGKPTWLHSVSREWSLYFKLSHPFSFPWAMQPFPSLK